MEDYSLSDCQSTDASDRGVDSRVILVRATQEFRGLIPQIECSMSIETRFCQVSSAEKNGTGRCD